MSDSLDISTFVAPGSTPPRPGAITSLSAQPPLHAAVPINPMSHPGPPPQINPMSHPGPPPSINPLSHPGPPPPAHPLSHPGPPPTAHPLSHPGPPPSQAGSSWGSQFAGGSPAVALAESGSVSAPIKVRLRHTQEIVCEKPLKNTSFSGRTTVVEIVPFSGTPKSLTLVGNAPGDTHVTLLFTDGTADRLAVSVAG